MPDMKVKDIMTTSFFRADVGILLKVLQDQIENGDGDAVIFFEGQDIKGVFDCGSISQAVGDMGAAAAEVLDIKEPVRVSAEDDVGVVSAALAGGSGLLVVTGKEICGVITPHIMVRNAVKAAQRSRAILDAILRHAGEAICVIDKFEKVEYWNHGAEMLYGIKEKEILGQQISNYFSNILVVRSLRGGEVFREIYHQPREGAHVLITSAPVLIDDGSIIGSVSLEKDIADIVYFNEELSRTSFKVSVLKNEISRLSKKDPFSRIYGHSRAIKETVRVAKKYAATETTLLIMGESGSGKELFAQAIHEESYRSDKPFVAVNCSAIPQTLFESEIFGYEGGSFTGAFKGGRPGKFELADGGTLFLDEIGDLEKGLQVKLLRVLQEKVLYRVGGTRPVKVDVRIIAATNRDLEKMVQEGRFREDLFYRLNVITLKLPPLRERREDLPELVYLLTRELSVAHGKSINEFEPGVMVAFMNHHWPGNVRELRNILERMVILAEDEVIRLDNLPDFLSNKDNSFFIIDMPRSAGNLTEITSQTERQMIADALQKASDNKSEAAKLLGIPRSSLYYKMKVLGLLTKN